MLNTLNEYLLLNVDSKKKVFSQSSTLNMSLIRVNREAAWQRNTNSELQLSLLCREEKKVKSLSDLVGFGQKNLCRFVTEIWAQPQILDLVLVIFSAVIPSPVVVSSWQLRFGNLTPDKLKGKENQTTWSNIFVFLARRTSLQSLRLSKLTEMMLKTEKKRWNYPLKLLILNIMEAETGCELRNVTRHLVLLSLGTCLEGTAPRSMT